MTSAQEEIQLAPSQQVSSIDECGTLARWRASSKSENSMNWRHFDPEVRFQFVLNREGQGTTEL